jgi:hypothetical protein
VPGPQLPQRQANCRQSFRPSHVLTIFGRSRPATFAPGQAPLQFAIDGDEDVVLTPSQSTEDAPRQLSFSLNDEVHRIVRQVVVVAGTLTGREARPVLAHDRHEVTPP